MEPSVIIRAALFSQYQAWQIFRARNLSYKLHGALKKIGCSPFRDGSVRKQNGDTGKEEKGSPPLPECSVPLGGRKGVKLMDRECPGDKGARQDVLGSLSPIARFTDQDGRTKHIVSTEDRPGVELMRVTQKMKRQDPMAKQSQNVALSPEEVQAS